MLRWKEALRAYRRRSLEGHERDETRPVMFVVCSEDHDGSELVAACAPAMVLQTLGGVRTPSDASIRATFEHAVREKGVGHVIVCGHEGCSAFGPQASSEKVQLETAAQCRSLGEDAHIGPLLREAGVKIRALWFDAPEGDVYACDVEGKPPALIDDEELARTLLSFSRT